jgi:peptidoglycan/LPS O-acetylase OafA/YrhL
MERGHIPELDGLRALAVLAVIAYHGNVLQGGGVGVDVFFVLSGWLITGILLGGRRLADFFESRARRLVPALLALLAVVLAIDPSAWRDVLVAATYTMNFREAFAPQQTFLSHTWSLAQEWQFYLLWPIALPVLLRAGRKRAAAILAGLWVVGALAAAWLLTTSADAVRWYSAAHVTGLFLGAALAIWPRAETPRWVGLAGLTATVVAFCIPAGAGGPAGGALSIPLSEAGAALLISRPPSFLAAPALVWLGTISYGVYLWHLPVYAALTALPMWPRLFGTLALSVAIAAISFRYLERPIMAAGRRRASAPPGPTLAFDAKGR